MTSRAAFAQLMLQLERALVAQSQIRALLTAADETVANRRWELRNLEARMARRSPRPGRAE
jgi:hypothetical protein